MSKSEALDSIKSFNNSIEARKNEIEDINSYTLKRIKLNILQLSIKLIEAYADFCRSYKAFSKKIDIENNKILEIGYRLESTFDIATQLVKNDEETSTIIISTCEQIVTTLLSEENHVKMKSILAEILENCISKVSVFGKVVSTAKLINLLDSDMQKREKLSTIDEELSILEKKQDLLSASIELLKNYTEFRTK